MQIISEQTAKHTGKILGWSSRFMGLTCVRAAIFTFALLHNPVPVLGVTFSGPYSVTLAWQSGPSADVAGYRVYYGSASGNYTNSVVVGNVTTNTISGLTSGVTYYMAVSAVGADGLESPLSNEISFVPGVPAVRIRAASARQFVLTVSGLIGQTYEILATQDLKTWAIIGTVTLGAGGSLDFTDTNSASFPQRFYRTQAIP